MFLGVVANDPSPIETVITLGDNPNRYKQYILDYGI